MTQRKPAPPVSAEGRYRVEFDRISSHRDVPPLEVYAADADELAKKVCEYARPRCLSRDISVTLDFDTMAGTILAGSRPLAGSQSRIWIPRRRRQVSLDDH